MLHHFRLQNIIYKNIFVIFCFLVLFFIHPYICLLFGTSFLFLNRILFLSLYSIIYPLSVFYTALCEMGCNHHHAFCGQRLSFVSFSLFFLIISSRCQLEFVAEGRRTLNQNGFQQTVSDEKAMMRAQIGSRPPRCNRICRSCGHCEAIQVPTNPQMHNGKINSSTVSTIAYASGEDTSNYKPMSWKCKCGNLIFNP